MLKGIGCPALLEESNVEFFWLDTARLADHMSKDVILVFTLLPNEVAVLARSGNATSDGLVDVDAFIANIVLEVLDEQGDCTNGDGLPLQPSDPLKGEDLVGGIRQGFVLKTV